MTVGAQARAAMRLSSFCLMFLRGGRREEVGSGKETAGNSPSFQCRFCGGGGEGGARLVREEGEREDGGDLWTWAPP